MDGDIAGRLPVVIREGTADEYVVGRGLCRINEVLRTINARLSCRNDTERRRVERGNSIAGIRIRALYDQCEIAS